MKWFQIIASAVVVTVMLFLLSITVFSSLYPSDDWQDKGRSFDVPEGVSLRWIADSLSDHGFIKNSTLFLVLGKLTLSEKEIMAGEYLFSAGMSIFDILDYFKEGKVNYRRVMIQPGYNSDQIGSLLASEDLVDINIFRDLIDDQDLIKNLNIDAPSLEGFLYPDTYYFVKGNDPRRMIRKMVLRFKEIYTPAMEARANELGMTMNDIVTLASIIEKEAIVEKDRPVISAVFHNRLKKNMPLQSDPTVIYALGDSFDGNLKRVHLKLDSSYNTYMRRGLPPGPIGNPGIESIRAALYPADVDYLYFVSKNDNTHYFSKSLREHNRAVAKYQKAHPNLKN